MVSNFEILIRMALACLLGGLIGIEREKNRHPAGLRTHILVCIGATLVMLCNQYLFNIYRDFANIDPARLGAQVISGIGFLGAGTIIKEGVSIKGLTTAASLWAVACIGISIGIGFYTGAILTTSFVLITLMIFSRIEYTFYRKTNRLSMVIKADKDSGIIDKVADALERMDIHVSNIASEVVEQNSIKVILKTINRKNIGVIEITRNINRIDGIHSIEICE